MGTDFGQNEAALVCAAQSGDQAAVQQLLIGNWAWLRCLVYGVVGTRDLDDALQDVCVKVIRKIGTLRDPHAFRPWLAALAHRQALRYRTRRPAPSVSLDDENIEEPCDARTESAMEQAERRDLCQQILRAVQDLPEKYREVFLLQYSRQLTYKEIAEILDVPLTTVQIRLVRARRMILEAIRKKSKGRIYDE
ncbi:MAG: RNA polymerase sigma factor [Phycisphaerae bacterium]|nr:RNA polymerase sigma factor [Phycisphaerae bacterium]